MRIKILAWLVVCCAFASTAKAQLYVSGVGTGTTTGDPFMYIDGKAYVYIDGNLYYGGKLAQAINLQGKMDLYGNWYNESADDKKVFTDTSHGTVIMSGKLQTFNGLNTRFPNLQLISTGLEKRKQQLTTVEVKEVLDLTNCELDVSGNTMTILSNSLNAVQYTDGYVNTSANNKGWLIRNMNKGQETIFPLGSTMGGVFRFRPLLLTSQEAGNVAGQFQDYVPSRDGYTATAVDGVVDAVNNKWYHAISTDVSGGNSVLVRVPYNESVDGNFATMVNWLKTGAIGWQKLLSTTMFNYAFTTNDNIFTAAAPMAMTANTVYPVSLAKLLDKFLIPNVITPNGDGKNDKLVISGASSSTVMDIVIFNRWGNVVYKNANYDNSWDAQGLNSGTYFYELKVKDNGTVKQYKGFVMVMK